MAASTRRPNIVMILSDDHAAHSISAYGSVVNRTPRIDEIGERGWVLDNLLVTNSLCAPSRASILTGTYSHINGVSTLWTPIEASQPTFITQLRAAGYRTAIIGKWHLGHGEGHDPRGFDYWDVVIDQGEYWNPRFLSAAGIRTVTGYATDIITDLALGWAESLTGGDPWCLLIYHKAPHRPWEPKAEHKARYATSSPPLPTTFWDDYATRSASVRRTTMRVADNLTGTDLKVDPPEGLSGDELAVWKYRRFMRDYLACVESVDENVGRVIDWLGARGDFDDTLLMYASDQGFFLGDHGWFDKRLMFEESLRMPCLISCPRLLSGGRRFDGLVTNVDLAQTILDAAGVAHHPRMQGRSFWPDLIGQQTGPPVDGVYYRYWEHDDVNHHAPAHYGYRTERHKIIYYYNDGVGAPGSGRAYPPEWELYDLRIDPGELNNVYDDPAYLDLRERLKSAMWREQARLGDAPHPSQPKPIGVDSECGSR